MKTWIRETYQNYKAWRRGERRIAPAGTRGRIYEQVGASSPGAHMIETKTTYKTLARVIRADGRPDEYYNLTDGTRQLSSHDFENLRGDKTHG